MEKTIDIVRNALEYYDMNTEKYIDLFNDIHYISFKNQNVNDPIDPIIIMYDSNKNKIFESKYELIGVLDNKTKIWIWGWSIPGIGKKIVNTVRKILNYGLDLDPTDLYLRTQLITSRFRIDSNAQIDSHIAVTSYLAKKNIIFKYTESETNFINEGISVNKEINLLTPLINLNNNYIYIKDKTKNKIITYYLFLLDIIK